MVAPQSVYLDYSATTPVDPRVLEKMMPYFSDHFGNTSSSHTIGRRAESAIEDARETIARIFNCSPQEIIFTSGGSESDNLAIRGAGWLRYQAGAGNHLITTPVEHSAVTRTIDQMTQHMGFEQTLIPVDKTGMVDVEDFADSITEQTTLASIIYANNEIGTIAPLPKLSEHAHEKNILLHTDAVQAAGQLTLDVQLLGVDLMSISAHKFYGPKGVGALYCRSGVDLLASQTGGSHEQGRRAGTLNTPGIVGMAAALEIAYREQAEHIEHYTRLRDYIIDRIVSEIPESELTGQATERLPSHASFVFPGVDSSKLLMHLDMKGVAASGGSACKTGNPEPSSVLLAMGYPEDIAIGSLRLSVGRYTTIENIDYAIETIKDRVDTLRNLN